MGFLPYRYITLTQVPKDPAHPALLHAGSYHSKFVEMVLPKLAVPSAASLGKRFMYAGLLTLNPNTYLYRQDRNRAPASLLRAENGHLLPPESCGRRTKMLCSQVGVPQYKARRQHFCYGKQKRSKIEKVVQSHSGEKGLLGYLFTCALVVLVFVDFRQEPRRLVRLRTCAHVRSIFGPRSL